MHSRSYYYVTGGFFGLVTVLHVVRLILQIPVQIGSWNIPMWASWAGLIVGGLMFFWAARLARS